MHKVQTLEEIAYDFLGWLVVSRHLVAEGLFRASDVQEFAARTHHRFDRMADVLNFMHAKEWIEEPAEDFKLTSRGFAEAPRDNP